MLLEELIEKAFSDGYEYALKQKIFFLSTDGHAFTGKDIRRELREHVLAGGPNQNSISLAYKNTGMGIDQLEARLSGEREMRRKLLKSGVKDRALVEKMSHTAGEEYRKQAVKRNLKKLENIDNVVLKQKMKRKVQEAGKAVKKDVIPFLKKITRRIF